jgi:hypothetical protein
MLVFYFTIILYFTSLASILFFPQFSEIAGILAFGFFIAFILAGIISRNILIDGKNVSAFKFISHLKERAYDGGILPKIYSNEFPQAYFELVNKAESGKEMP